MHISRYTAGPNGPALSKLADNQFRELSRWWQKVACITDSRLSVTIHLGPLTPDWWDPGKKEKHEKAKTEEKENLFRGKIEGTQKPPHFKLLFASNYRPFISCVSPSRSSLVESITFVIFHVSTQFTEKTVPAFLGFLPLAPLSTRAS